jgi:putative membrane protein
MKGFVLPSLVFCSLIVPASLVCAQSDSMMQPPSASQTQPNQPGRPAAPTTSMQDSSGAPADSAQQMKDKMFVHKAAEGGLAEVELGKLASQKSGNADVQAFGKRMVEDHTKLNQQIAQIADTIGARIPKKMGKDQQAEYDKLSALSGDEFDKEYIACMVKDHHKDLREFRMEASTTQDADLKAAVEQASQVIHDHMVTADKMAHDRGIPMPGHHHHPAESSATPPPAE